MKFFRRWAVFFSVNYSIVNDSNNSSAEGDGVFRLESFETKCCTWGMPVLCLLRCCALLTVVLCFCVQLKFFFENLALLCLINCANYAFLEIGMRLNSAFHVSDFDNLSSL
ncbi:hypothetical protein S83_062643 [Arachis hypogaea]